MNENVVKPSDNFEYYSGAIYWNNFDIVQAEHNKRITGTSTTSWQNHLLGKYGKVESAFVFSCGNGWVERSLFQNGNIERVIAFDIMEQNLDIAVSEAKKINMPSIYFRADANAFRGFKDRCGLVVNYAAMHHISHLNGLTEALAKICENGIYVGMDYTGAHRNQYGWNVWSKILETNQRLPEKYRVKPRYGHLPTMLATDPSEAVHSELQVEVLLRHFDVLEFARLGGGIAYTLLFQNHRLFAEQHTAEGRAALELVMQADADALALDPDFNLISFFVAKPKKPGSISPSQLLTWQAEEDEREARAAQNGGRYYPPTPLEMIYNELADAEYTVKVLQAAPKS